MTEVAYQFMPPLSPEEYRALEESIEANGIQVPILVDEQGRVIDGHHRQKIASELGIDCPSRTVTGKSEVELRTLALSLNLDRRHLNREQRRNLVAASLKADPQLSNREHARRTGVDHKTVTALREPLEATGEIPQLDKTVGADGRTRPATITRTVTEREVIDAETGEVLPAPAHRKPPRPKLTDQFFNAAFDLTRKAEAIHRLAHDDRFPQNAKKLAQKHLNELRRSQDLLQQVIDRLS